MSKEKVKVFPWEQEVRRLLLASIGSNDSKLLQSAMLHLLREVTPYVDDFIAEKKFHSGKRLLSVLRHLLVHFDLRRRRVDKETSSPSLTDLVSAFLSIMLDLRIFLTTRNKNPVSKDDTLSHVIFDTLVFTDTDARHMIWDTILQSTSFREKRNKELGCDILDRLLSESPWTQLQSPERYLKCLLCMRLWYQNASRERKPVVMSRAVRMPLPKRLSRWLSSANLQGLPLYTKKANPKTFVKPFLKNMGQDTADSLCTALSEDIVEDDTPHSCEPDQTAPEELGNDGDSESLFVFDRTGAKNPDDCTSEMLLQQIDIDLQNLPELPAKLKKPKRKMRDNSVDSSELDSRSCHVTNNSRRKLNKKLQVRKLIEFEEFEKSDNSENDDLQFSVEVSCVSKSTVKSKSPPNFLDEESDGNSQIKRRKKSLSEREDSVDDTSHQKVSPKPLSRRKIPGSPAENTDDSDEVISPKKFSLKLLKGSKIPENSEDDDFSDEILTQKSSTKLHKRRKTSSKKFAHNLCTGRKISENYNSGEEIASQNFSRKLHAKNKISVDSENDNSSEEMASQNFSRKLHTKKKISEDSENDNSSEEILSQKVPPKLLTRKKISENSESDNYSEEISTKIFSPKLQTRKKISEDSENDSSSEEISSQKLSPKLHTRKKISENSENDNSSKEISSQKFSPKLRKRSKTPESSDKKTSPKNFQPKSPTQTKISENEIPSKKISPKSCNLANKTKHVDNDDSDSTVENLFIRKPEFHKLNVTRNDDDLSVLLDVPSLKKILSERISPAKSLHTEEQHLTPGKSSHLLFEKIESKDGIELSSELDKPVIVPSQSAALSIKEAKDKPDLLPDDGYYVADGVTQTDFSGDEGSALNCTDKIIIRQPSIKPDDDDCFGGSQQLFASQTSLPNFDLSDEFLSPETTPYTTPENTMTSSTFDRIKDDTNFLSLQKKIDKNLLSLNSMFRKEARTSPSKSCKGSPPKSTSMIYSPLKRFLTANEFDKTTISASEYFDNSDVIDRSTFLIADELLLDKGFSSLKDMDVLGKASPTKSCSPVKTNSLISSPSKKFLTSNECDKFTINASENADQPMRALSGVTDSSAFKSRSANRDDSPSYGREENKRKDKEVESSTSPKLVLENDSTTFDDDEDSETGYNSESLLSSLRQKSPTNKSPTKSEKITKKHKSSVKEKLFLTPVSMQCNSEQFSPGSMSTVVSKPGFSGKEAGAGKLPSPVKREIEIRKMQKCSTELESYLDSLHRPEASEKNISNEDDTPKTSRNKKPSLTSESDVTTSKRKIRNVESRKKVSCIVNLEKLEADVAENNLRVSDASDSELSSTETLPFMTKIRTRVVPPCSSLDMQEPSLSDKFNRSFELPKTYSRIRKKSVSTLQDSEPSSNVNNDSDSSVTVSKLTQNNKEHTAKKSQLRRKKKENQVKSYKSTSDDESSSPESHVEDELRSSQKSLSQTTQLSPNTQSAVQSQTYMIIDDFLQECRTNLHKKVQLDDKCDSSVVSGNGDDSTVHSQPKLTPTSEAAVQTVLQSRHIAMLTPNIGRKPRQTKKADTSMKSTPVSQSRITRSCSKPKSVQKRLKVSSMSTENKKLTKMRIESAKSKRQQDSLSDVTEIPDRMATRSSRQPEGYSIRLRPKTPSRAS